MVSSKKNYVSDFLTSPEGMAFKRLIKSSLALLIACVVAYLSKQPELIALAPILMAIEKYLKEKFNN